MAIQKLALIIFWGAESKMKRKETILNGKMFFSSDPKIELPNLQK